MEVDYETGIPLSAIRKCAVCGCVYAELADEFGGCPRCGA